MTLFITGEQSRFIEAINKPIIKNCTQGNVKDTLALVMVKVGLRAANIPNDLETAVLLSHIATEYGNHTCEEIKLAFDLAIAAKLDLKDVSCYENFSCLYFSTIMNAYRLWAKEQAAQIKTKPVEKEEKKKMTQSEKMDWIEEWRQKHDLSLDYLPFHFYQWLNLDNYTEYLERSMNFCRQKIIDENTSFAYKKTQLAEFKRQEEEGFEGAFKILIVNTAKRMAIFHHLKPKPNEQK